MSDPASARPWFSQNPWLAGLALTLAVALAYLPSLGGEFLNYDDTWLVRDNPVFRAPFAPAMRAIWTDLSLAARMRLGAEFLPVRDTCVWLEAALLGVRAPAMRAVGLALYLAAVLLARRWFHRALGPGLRAELAAWLFALHPLHVESAAWLAGRKDLLALVFMVGAVLAYGASSKRARALVPLLAALAALSKAVAVALPALLVLEDLRQRRRPPWLALGGATLAAAGALALHLAVGRTVHMVTPPLGGSRLTALLTMAVVTWRSLAHAVVPAGLSVRYEVALHPAGSPYGWAALAGLVALLAFAAARARRGDRAPLLLAGLFLLPQGPTSQVLAPLENVTADRYLMVAVAAPCVALACAVGYLAERGRARAAWLAAAALVAAFGALTAARAGVFATSVALWEDATRKTDDDPLPPYQLGMAHRARGDDASAERAFRLAWSRHAPPSAACSAADNLSILLERQGRRAEAVALLREARARCPDHPKVLNNLAELLARQGDPEGRRLYEELITRFPSYETGRRNYRRRYGP